MRSRNCYIAEAQTSKNGPKRSPINSLISETESAFTVPTSNPATILDLQRTHGNAFVRRLIQRMGASKADRQTSGAVPTTERGATFPGLLSNRETILDLQRTHGNAFVRRLIQRMRASEPGKHHPSSTVTKNDISRRIPTLSPSAINQIQRDVGFEFESTQWRPWVNQPVGYARAAKRKEVLHEGTKFRVEGDDSPGENLANMEFVTEPFSTDQTGLTELAAALDKMGQILTTLPAGKPGPGPDSEAKKTPMHVYAHYKSKERQKYVQPGEHRFTNSEALLSKGSGNLVKMQATSGIRLGDLPMVMKTFGKPMNESLGDTQRLDKARKDMNTGASNFLGAVPAVADAVVTKLISDIKGHMQTKATHKRLTGFLAALIAYLKGLQFEDDGALKYRAPLMLRQDFATLWSGVPDATRQVLKANIDIFIQSILAVSNANPLIRIKWRNPKTQLSEMKNADENLQPASPLVPTHPHLAELTIERWIKGIVENGKDLLNPSELDIFLSSKGVNQTKRDEAKSDLESFASIKDLDRNTDGHRMGVFENRALFDNKNAFEGGAMDFPRAARNAYNYLMYFIAVDERKAQKSKFKYPDTDIP